MPINPIIIDSPILLFLGAGASQPLNKAMMHEFVARLTPRIADATLRNLLDHLIRFRGNDLEALLAEMDTLIGLDYASMVRCPDRQNPNAAFEIYRQHAEVLMTTVKHEIIREYRSVDPGSVSKAYEPLLDLVFSLINPDKHCLAIFTTNYDPAGRPCSTDSTLTPTRTS